MKMPFLLSIQSVNRVVRAFSAGSGDYPERFLMRLAKFAGGLWEYSRFLFRPKGHNHDFICNVEPTSASISTPTVAWLFELLHDRQPHSILEIGTGYSSLVFHSYAKRKGNVSVTSLEHDPFWHEKQLETLRRLGISSEIDLIFTPLTHVRTGVKPVAFYDASVVDRFFEKCDLVFVDGPVGSMHGGPGREGSLKQGIDAAMKGGLVLLHDALREEEFLLIQTTLRADCNVKLLGFFPDTSGLAVLEKQ